MTTISITRSAPTCCGAWIAGRRLRSRTRTRSRGRRTAPSGASSSERCAACSAERRCDTVAKVVLTSARRLSYMPSRPAIALLTVALFALPPSRVEAAEAKQPRKMNLAFVLLSDAKLPRGEAVERAFRAYAGDGQSLRYLPDSRDKATRAKYPVDAFETRIGQAVVGL